MKLFFSLTLIFTLLIQNNYGQITIKLTKRGDQRYSKTLEGGDIGIQTFKSIPLDIKLPKNVGLKSDLHYTELNSQSLFNPNITNSVYLLLEKKDTLYSLYSSESKDFYYAKKVLLNNNTASFEMKSKNFGGTIPILIDKPNHLKSGFFANGLSGFDTTNINNWLSYKFSNIKYGELILNKQKIYIGVADIYNDGVLDDGRDLIFCSDKDYGFFYLGGTSRLASRVFDTNYIKFNKDTVIKVSNINWKKNELAVTIVKTDLSKNYSINYFTKINGGQKFMDSEGQSHSFGEYLNQGKYIFINFWTSYCTTCTNQFPIYDSLDKFSDKIKIISFLEKDETHEELPKLIKRYNINHLTGWSDENISYEFIYNGYPHGVLFDPKGNLVDFLDLGGKKMVYRELIDKYCNDSNNH